MKTVLKEKKLCTGCGACAASCGSQAISMLADEEGFLFPIIDEEKCTECGLCERICPINPDHPKELWNGEPLATLAAWNRNDEIRMQSSSGGIFTVLAERILDEDGVVVGAAFDNEFCVRHVMVDAKPDLARLRGSKYVQSKVSQELYVKIRSTLRNGRKVLFSGTPCQIAGMRSFLKKQDGILYVDILCHGVPSPLLWKKYLESLPDSKEITGVSFRDKTFGWKNFSLSVKSAKGKSVTEQLWRNTYMQAFLRDLGLRQACYSCPFARKQRVSDITLADFWGIEIEHPQYDDARGISLVLANSKSGHLAIESQSNSIAANPVEISTAVMGNPILSRPSHCPPERAQFYKFLVGKSFDTVVKKYNLGQPFYLKRAILKLKRILRKTYSRAAGQ